MKHLSLVVVALLALSACDSKQPAPEPAPAEPAAEAPKAANPAPAKAAPSEAPKEKQATRLTLLAASKDGNYHKAATAMSDAVKAKGFDIQVKESPGSFHNIEALGTGQADMALAQYDTIMVYQNQGDEGRKIIERAKVFAPAGRELVHVIAGVDTKIEGIMDLNGRRIGVGPKHSGSWISAWAVMHHLHKQNVEAETDSFFLGEHKDQLKKVLEGDLDAMFVTTAPGMPLLQKVTAEDSARLTLLGLPKDYIVKMPMDAVYVVGSIPAGSYPFAKEAVETFSTRSYLLVRADIPEADVTALAKAFYFKSDDLANASDNWRDLHPNIIREDIQRNPYHPGVIAEFPEKK